MLSSHTVGFQRPDNSNLANLTPGLCSSSWSCFTHLRFPSDFTIEKKGTSTVSIQTTGHEMNRFTVMLACMSDGTKLPPYIGFKRKTLPKGIKFPSGVNVHVKVKGWMNDELMMDWYKCCVGQSRWGLSSKFIIIWGNNVK